MKRYTDFIKKEYKRLFGEVGFYIPKYSVGDRVKVARMSGNGIATILSINNNPCFSGEPSYEIRIDWTTDDKGNPVQSKDWKKSGYSRRSLHESQCKGFDKSEGKWYIYKKGKPVNRKVLLKKI